MYGRSCANVKLEPRSQLLLNEWLSYIACLYFIYARKNYATVEIHTKRHYGAYEYDYEYDLHDTSENYAL